MAQAKKRKKFIDVNIPLINKETQLYAYDVKDLDGRFIKYDLTRMLRGKSVLLRLEIKVEKDTAIAIPIEMRVLPYFLRRMMRKGTNYVEDSFSTKCKDARVRIKPFLITRKKVSRAVRKALREKAREELIDYMKDRKTETVFEEIFRNQLQKTLSLKLKKIYPLSLCEIRIFKVEEFLESGDKEK